MTAPNLNLLSNLSEKISEEMMNYLTQKGIVTQLQAAEFLMNQVTNKDTDELSPSVDEMMHLLSLISPEIKMQACEPLENKNYGMGAFLPETIEKIKAELVITFDDENLSLIKSEENHNE